ncbi:hypothetical protein Pst134EA_021396 [Puccinia striiformis f. sp. tritici]|uniref:hypothetical protein n=1 Tax=Puccinia striiformis f. sp. tritici TaxID=168172 RepID=UPI002007F515|nr:hypothetical protein Pst134EA_021396 [Puccinia striiformis f. sp. tritici]KAH9457519.1 hypothetical protein Pst134EA_021396 [Puccinia striiformis f. sp. tritici]
MSSIITRYYLLKQLVAWHFALRMAWGQPALHGLGKSYPSEFDLYSNPEDLAQVYNLGRSHNPNRLSENQQIYRQPDLGLETLRTNSNGQGSHRLMEPEHAFPSNVVKRQKTVQHYGGISSSHNPGPQMSHPGAAHPSVFQGAQRHESESEFYEFASSPASPPSASSLGSLPLHDIGLHDIWDDEAADLTAAAPMSGTISHTEVDTSHDDPTSIAWLFNQLESEKFDGQEWSSFFNQLHAPLPATESSAAEDQAQRQDHSQFQYNPPSRQDDTQLEAPDEAQDSHRTADDITDRHTLSPSHSSGQLDGEDSAKKSVHRTNSKKRSWGQVYDQSPRDEAGEQQENQHTRSSIPAKDGSSSSGAHSTLPATAMNDRFLAQIVLPGTAINDQILHTLTEKFKVYLAESFKVTNTRNSPNTITIGELPVRLNRLVNTDVFIIRVALRSQFRSPRETRDRSQRSLKLFGQFKKLIKWLAFINASVLTEIEDGLRNYKEEFQSHKELVEWLYLQAFYPEKSFPVIGIVPKINKYKPGEEFGEVQLHLIDYLSMNRDSREELRTALLIIRVYYENHKPETWNWINNLPKDERIENIPTSELDPALMLITLNALKSGLRVPRAFGETDEPLALGNFQICQLDYLPDSMKPLHIQIKYAVHLGIQEETTLQLIHDTISSMGALDDPQGVIQSDEFPIVLLKKTSEQEQTLSGYLWVLLEVNEMASKKHITLKLKLLMQNLKACHVEFMGHLNTKNIELKTQAAFFKWFHELLMVGPQDKSPLLGKLKLQTESLEHLSFSEAQLFLLMHYLSDRKSQTKAVQVSLSLIGYWYKENQGKIFSDVFESDQLFWDQMIAILKPKFTFRGGYSIRNFLHELSG